MYTATQIDIEDNDTFELAAPIQITTITGKIVSRNATVIVSLTKEQQALALYQNQLRQLQLQIVDKQARVDAMTSNVQNQQMKVG